TNTTKQRNPVSTNLRADHVALLIALIFASRWCAVVMFWVAVISQITLHSLVLHVPPIAGTLSFAADTLLRDGLIAIFFVFCLGITMAILIESAQRRGEEALRESLILNANLENLVSERTRELQAATTRANDASRAKGEFLANMSHEIRTPLYAIIASSELLMEVDEVPEDAREKAKIIADSGELLIKQIGDILDLSKIESGQVEIEQVPFALAPAVEDCVALLTAKADADGVAVSCEIAPEVPDYLLGDGFRIRQVLLNLLSNAIKFTPAEGRVSVVVTAVNEQDDLWRIGFEVRDSGIGMDEQAKAKVFQRYIQAEASTTRTHGGTGLGLAICLHLVELMGGHLEVESEVGVGSVFRFSLTMKKASTPVPVKTQGHSHEKHDLHVLVADDNPTNRKILGYQLEKLGCRASMVGNGELLLDAVRQNPLPDLILMDCEMPVLNGWETTQRLRGWANDETASDTQKRAARLRIVALTAATSSDEIARCRDVGMDDYLPKPIKLLDLQRVVRDAVRGKA
ncbi:MAG: ATP-binding protein, partial [Chthoniobacterales bacterium]